ncbi:hypothetical protein HZA40_01585 [Candidatus Peregrinibacteria bacterium]|nr:hypothetical protein [Candidatus Peregrinibacteria bacterium]
MSKIKEYFFRFRHHWKVLLSDHTFKVSFFVGVCFLTLAYVVDYAAAFYKEGQTYISVGDLLLDHIPTFNLEFLFTWGMYGLTALIFIYPIFFKPELTPFAIKTYAFLLYIRSGSILLTNLGPPHGFFFDSFAIGKDVIADVFFRNDLFFSGHTAFPFLAFLLYRDSWIKWVFLAGSLVEATTVLLMHVHYSIDVVAAFFFAYGTYALSRRFFHPLNQRFVTSIRLYGWDAVQKLKKI